MLIKLFLLDGVSITFSEGYTVKEDRDEVVRGKRLISFAVSLSWLTNINADYVKTDRNKSS